VLQQVQSRRVSKVGLRVERGHDDGRGDDVEEESSGDWRRREPGGEHVFNVCLSVLGQTIDIK